MSYVYILKYFYLSYGKSMNHKWLLFVIGFLQTSNILPLKKNVCKIIIIKVCYIKKFVYI